MENEFEQKMARLDAITKTLEKGESDLTTAMNLFNEARALIKALEAQLNQFQEQALLIFEEEK